MLIVGERSRQSDLGHSIVSVTDFFGYNRTYYYEAKQKRQERAEAGEAVLKLARQERRKHSRMSGRKMHHKLKPKFVDLGIKLGRSGFYDLLRQADMLVKPRKWTTVTTNSRHAWRRYENLIKTLEINRPNQVWVSDITYIYTLKGYLYLSLIMDAYSRKIVGWCLHDSLATEGCLQALKMAIRSLPQGFDGKGLIHHSDQGIQYCSYVYTGLLKQHQIAISMAEAGNCYENAQAERLNGILKQEYELGELIVDKSVAKKLCKQAVRLYNEDRPHLSLSMDTPSQVHQGSTAKVRMNWGRKPSHTPQAQKSEFIESEPVRAQTR